MADMELNDKLRMIGLSHKFNVSENGRIISKGWLQAEIDADGRAYYFIETGDGYDYSKVRICMKDIEELREFIALLGVREGEVVETVPVL